MKRIIRSRSKGYSNYFEKNNVRAFTLIELMISIVVLGIIAVIAIPKVSQMISFSRKGSFETSAKSIARKVKNEYASGNIPGTQVNCLNSKYKTMDGNYESCTADIFVNEEDVIVSLDLVGKGSYAGYTILGAKEDMAHAFETANTQSLRTRLLTDIKGTVVYGPPPATGGLYQWGTKFIYRGGITISNTNGLATNQYASDTYDKISDIANYVKVPWENNTLSCESAGVIYYTSSPCWRIMSINSDGGINITRDRDKVVQVFDNTHNTTASNYYYNLYVSNPTQYASYANAQTTNYGYNDLLENVPTSGYPEEYRQYSPMYTKLYGDSGYELNDVIKYITLLQPTEICLNKVNNYTGINDSAYTTTTKVVDTCNIINKSNTSAVT